jgi:hypothetical protein
MLGGSDKMSQKLSLPLPVWEGMYRIKEISKALTYLYPTVEIPHSYPRSIKMRHLLPSENENSHLEIKYWFPTAGTVTIEVSGRKSRLHGTFFVMIGLKANWKDSRTKTEVQLNQEQIEKLKILSNLLFYDKARDFREGTNVQKAIEDLRKNIDEAEKELKMMIDKNSIVIT